MKSRTEIRNSIEFRKSQRNFNILKMLVKRHLKMIFADHMRMMYTLMVPVIIFIVYLLFLREMEINAVENELLRRNINLTSTDGQALAGQIHSIIDCWMFSGLLSISALTISLQTNALLVTDKENGVNRDFVSSPINKNILIISYFIYNFLITIFLTFIIWIVCLVTLGIYQGIGSYGDLGGFVLNARDIFTTIGITLFSCLLATLINTFICLFINTEGTLASVIAAFSAAAGFLMGAYMPISLLKPEGIQYLCAVFPLTYACALSRFGFLATPFTRLGLFIEGHPSLIAGAIFDGKPVTGAEVISTVENSFGYKVNFFGAASLGEGFSTLVVVVFIILFLGLNIAFAGRLAKLEKKPLFRKHNKN
jgi:multidrug/hemolysin transport system permease protein